YANAKINTKLVNYRNKREGLLKIIENYLKTLKKLKDQIYIFKKFIEYRAINHNKKIPKADAQKIMPFYQSGYIDQLGHSVDKFQNCIKNIKIFYNNAFHYTDRSLNQILETSETIKNDHKNLKMELRALERDVETLQK
ncbi:MAG: hypothetical protein Q8K02_03235, partial [Flavobacterium sp.]|nr:hypothetical protein [Flavobacterium sp.]